MNTKLINSVRRAGKIVCTMFALWGGLVAAGAQTILDWGAADGDWSSADAWSGTTFINNPPFNFTADLNGATLTVTSGETLTVGQVISGNSGVGGGRVTAVLPDNQYTLSGVNATATGVALQASSGVSARFNSAGAVTVSGTQYLDQLLTTNFTGTRTISGGADATLRLATAGRSYSVLHNSAGDLVFNNVSLTNSDVLYSSNNYNLLLRNAGAGKLIFSGGTLASRDGVKFDNATTSETVLDNVTITTPGVGNHLQFANGSYTFKGVTTVSAHGAYNFLSAGYGGSLDFTAGSVFNAQGVGALNFGSGALVTVNVSGTVTTANAINVNGTTSFTVDGGYLATTGNNIMLGGNANPVDVTVSNGGYLGASGGIVVGYSTGLTTLTVNSGTAATGNNQATYIGRSSGTGVVNVSGGWYSSGQRIYVGQSTGRGELNVSSGTVSLNADIKLLCDIGSGFTVGAGAVAELNVSGGYVDIQGGNSLNINQQMTAASSAVFTISGGTLTAAGIAFGNNVTNTNTDNQAVMNLIGGTVIIRNAYGIHTGAYSAAGEYDATHTAADTQVNLGGGKIVYQQNTTQAIPLTLTGSNGNVTFEGRGTADEKRDITLSGALTGAGGLTVSYGTLLLTGANDYHGQTVINAGATLALGTITTHLAGADGSLTLTLADLSGPAFAGDGTLNLNFGTVSISDALTYANASGEFQLFDNSLLTSLSLGDNWLDGFTRSDDLWINDIDSDVFFSRSTGILNVAQIPEPGALALLLTGGVLLALLRRR
ncbi:MAG: PEP-CTERM sorting domain-containing protein [Verrucomicrobiales bacterium]|jgi:autotransporter-associated beta strand protein|nr:PEP-CTERM sorting domain-containing protein [Verrucomicrobiales bacterium]